MGGDGPLKVFRPFKLQGSRRNKQYLQLGCDLVVGHNTPTGDQVALTRLVFLGMSMPSFVFTSPFAQRVQGGVYYLPPLFYPHNIRV